MHLYPIILLLFVFCLSSANDDLYILIDESSVFNCRGVKNEIELTEDDIHIVNEKGNRVYYIKAPGNYSLHFQRIKVKKEFGYLAGEIGVTLQVPIIEGPAGIRFDLPYTMIPETGLLSQQCDHNSGIIERNGRQYCRYCDLCGISRKVESDLNNGGHKFLPTTDEDILPTGISCGSIQANEYQFKRSISLPDRSTLENLIKGKVTGIDDEIKKRLNKGRGRFQVFLNLITAEKPSISQKRWFDGSKECKCCYSNDSSCSSLSYLYCNIEDCKSGWAHQCLHNTARIAACYTVEFNYRLTTSYAEVVQFLRENNYPNQERIMPQVDSVPSSLRSPSRTPSSSTSTSELCVSAMPARLTHLRRYCTIFWNANLCCSHCQGVC